MPRFVILRHEFPASKERPLHWDFMLEDAGALLTWAINEEPCSGGSMDAEQIANHRIEFLDYEGPVSHNRGKVACWDRGEFEWQKRGIDELEIRLAGNTMQGTIQLRRTDPESHWWMIWFSEDRSNPTRCTTEE